MRSDGDGCPLFRVGACSASSQHGLTKEDLGVTVEETPMVVETESDNDDDEEDDDDEEEEILVCKFDHTNWLDYQPEGNPAYCGKKAMFGNRSCFRCERNFVSDKKNLNDGKYDLYICLQCIPSKNMTNILHRPKSHYVLSIQ